MSRKQLIVAWLYIVACEAAIMFLLHRAHLHPLAETVLLDPAPGRVHGA